MAGEYIFTISGLKKVYGHKAVFENINLCFYHGAKIGFVGENGAGKSTLLRIMAGEEKEFEGRAEPLKGTKVGFLPQEPKLDPDKTVRQEVEDAFGDIKQMIDDFNAVSASMAEPMSDEEMEKAIEKWGGSRMPSMPPTAGSWTGKWKWRWMHWFCQQTISPPGRCPEAKLDAWRCVNFCW